MKGKHSADAFEQALRTGAELRMSLLALKSDVDALVAHMRRCFEVGGTVYVFGNGGSAADAQHMASELVSGCFAEDGQGRRAVALTTDTSVLTALGNDHAFDDIFARQIDVWAGEKDVVIGISTSGTSPNVVRALQRASARGATTAALTGKLSADAHDLADVVIQVPSTDTQRVQEAHITLIHLFCAAVA